ncbi:MAG TPA: hypothetical protein VG984_00195, partial [Candidatus Paceibacterota bacterium]|nr:hypothetical protein [Candidatus Paceibacterota bacterium]
SDVATNGVQIFKSFPTITYTASNGGVFTVGNVPLITVTIAADSKGDVTMNRLTFNIATTTTTVISPTFTGPGGSVGTVSAPDANGNVVVSFNSVSNTSDAVIPAGSSKSYTFKGTTAFVSPATTGSVSISLKGDTYAAVNTVSGLSTSNMIWSPESTTTSTATTNLDWANGYGLGGCFTSAGLGNDCFAATLAK